MLSQVPPTPFSRPQKCININRLEQDCEDFFIIFNHLRSFRNIPLSPGTTSPGPSPISRPNSRAALKIACLPDPLASKYIFVLGWHLITVLYGETKAVIRVQQWKLQPALNNTQNSHGDPRPQSAAVRTRSLKHEFHSQLFAWS